MSAVGRLAGRAGQGRDGWARYGKVKVWKGARKCVFSLFTQALSSAWLMFTMGGLRHYVN